MTTNSELSIFEIYNLLKSQNIDFSGLVAADVAEYVNEYRQDWQVLRDLRNVDYAARNPKKRTGRKSGRSDKGRKSQFRADSILSVIEVKS